MITNVVLSLFLIQSMREMGIAVATAISAWVNALLLYLFLAIIIYFGLVIMLKVLSVNQLREYLKK